MINAEIYQTEVEKQVEIRVNEGLATSVFSQESVDQLVAELIRNKTLCIDNEASLITSQEEVNQLVVDLLKDAAINEK